MVSTSSERSMNTKEHLETPKVLIVGAGPAGLGVSLALKQAGVTEQLVVDARDIGASFENWPKGMSLLSPSFNSNSFGLTDLNAIDPDTSPADFFKTQHPTGDVYAKYLKALAQHFQLPVSTGVEVKSVEKIDEGFKVQSTLGEIRPNYIVWAAGQFFFPRDNDFPGAEHALHSSKVKDWKQLEGDLFTVVGGYESGVDAAINLILAGKSVRLIARGEPWTVDHPDPSRCLSPRTFDRLRQILKNPELADKLEFSSHTIVKSIEKGDGFWILRDQDDIPIAAQTRPILATGFKSGLSIVSDLFEEDENGAPIFTEEADESTTTSGLFYSGPSLSHRDALFCFIYKFRARFGVIAAEIAKRLEKPDIEEKLEKHLKAGFMNTDLDCCTNCECAIEPDESAAPEPSSFAKA